MLVWLAIVSGLAGPVHMMDPAVNACELAASPAQFDGREIALYGRYQIVGGDRSVVTDDRCPAVAIEINLTTQADGPSEEFEEALEALDGARSGETMTVTLIGTFRSFPGQTQPLQLDVTQVFSAEVY